MSFNFPTQTYYGALPNPQNTTPAQYYLMQTLGQGGHGGQGVQGVQGVPLAHPNQHLIARAARLRRRLHAQWALAQDARRRANAPRPRPLGRQHRGNTCYRRETEFERRLKENSKLMEANLKRYSISDPKQLILKADVFVLGDVLRACKPVQLQAMYELAVDLAKANEDVPAHTAGLFNMLMGKDVNTPLVARTFEIAIR